MCNALKELVNEGVQTGIQKGRLEGIQAIVRTCYGICEKILVILEGMRVA